MTQPIRSTAGPGPANPYLPATEAAQHATLVAAAHSAHRAAPADTPAELTVTEVLRGAGRIVGTTIRVSTIVGSGLDVPVSTDAQRPLYYFLDGGDPARALYVTSSRTVAERLLAGLGPAEPMPSTGELRKVAAAADLVVRGLAHPRGPTTATLVVSEVVRVSAAGQRAGAAQGSELDIHIAPPADGTAAGGWHWTFDDDPDVRRDGVVGYYLLRRADAGWSVLNPVHPTRLTTSLVRDATGPRRSAVDYEVK